MLKPFLAAILGIVSSILTLFVMGRLGFAIFPNLAAFNPADVEETRGLLSALTLPPLLWLALSWSLAATSGVFIASKVSRGDTLPPACAAVFLLLATGSLLQSGAAPLGIGIGACAAVLMGTLTGWGLARSRG